LRKTVLAAELPHSNRNQAAGCIDPGGHASLLQFFMSFILFMSFLFRLLKPAV